jgi:hypothetical protein
MTLRNRITLCLDSLSECPVMKGNKGYRNLCKINDVLTLNAKVTTGCRGIFGPHREEASVGWGSLRICTLQNMLLK